MSISPLPVHLSCLGVSSDTVTIARGYSKLSYGDKLASVRNALNNARAEPSSAQASAIIMGAGGQAGAQASSPSHQAPQVRLQPLPAGQAQQVLGAATASAGPQSAGSSASTSSSSTAAFRAHTKHVKAADPALQALDFISIAVNSVGGGGVPRPYGRFQAARGGNGNAVWERLPPQPGTWQARALPIAVTLLGESHIPAGAGGGGGGGGGGAVGGGSGQANPSPIGAGAGDVREEAGTAGGIGIGMTAVSVSRHGSSVTPASAGPVSSQQQDQQQEQQPQPQGGSSPPETPGEGGVGVLAPEASRVLRLGFSTPDNSNSNARRRSGRSRSNPHSRILTRATYPGPGHAQSSPQHSPRSGGGGAPGLSGGPAGGGGGSGGGAAPAALAAGPAARQLYEASYYRRPGSSMHRSLVPLPPPDPTNVTAWFALPAATFLSDVPPVPEHLRMDNGYSVSREFLMSGLNPPRQRPPQPPPQSPTPHQQPPPPPGASEAPEDGAREGPQGGAQQDTAQDPSQDPPQPQPQDALQPHHHHHQHHHQQPPFMAPADPRMPPTGFYQRPPELRPQEKQVLWEALEKGGRAQQQQLPQHQHQHHHLPGSQTPVIGASKIRGVYVPLDKRSSPAPPSSEETLGWPTQGSGQGQGRMRYETIPSLLSGGGAARQGMRFPPEHVLPRRKEPTGW